MSKSSYKVLLALALVLLGSSVVLAEAGAGGGHAVPRTDVIGPTWAGLLPAITTLVVFVLLLVVLGKYAWGPIVSKLKEREDSIRRTVNEAKTNLDNAQAKLAQYEQQLATAEATIRQMMTNATADAEKAAENIRLRGRQEAEEIKEKANRDIEASRDEAIREIYTQAADLSTSIAGKIIRRELRVEDQKSLVEESLNRLQSVR
ncbi:MAG: F0F1 ATP synthase subunit B [Phycisphaerales bacterium]|nr:F0F1 ATP synthase subunit B [Phycisphaerales bacterium]